MVIAVAQRIAALRHPPRATRVAAALWVVLALVVWNVVFDRVIVIAGRRYVQAAAVAAQDGGPYVRIDDWMRPAVTRALWIATAAAGAVLVTGLASVRVASRFPNSLNEQVSLCASPRTR